ncbi:MAG: FAD-binding protein, partial [Casimicrobiaceae bacterium]
MKPDEAAASIQSTIKAAAACGRRCRIVGGGSKPWLAHASAAGSTEAEVLATKALSGIVEYEPTELVIVVRGGTPVAEVEQAMAEAGQMLAFEPPTADGRATIGGTLASAASGPRRAYAGAVRDFVLGVELIDGKGDRLRFGGKVMKNVAGFDISRLVCGSAGTLGVITEVAFKCLPLPKATETRVYELDMTAAIRAMN